MHASVAQILHELLESSFSPVMLNIEDESYKHAGHAGVRPEGETHFTVRIVSNNFEGKNRVQRHQMVYQAVNSLMNNPIHALAISAKTPIEVSETKDG